MSIRDGQKVAYVGHTAERIGDEGVALSTDDHCAHVRWDTGVIAGTVTLESNSDLVAQGVAPPSSFAFEGSLVAFSARTVYASGGDSGLLDALVDGGHIASLDDLPDQVLSMVAQALRRDPSFREVLSVLDDEEGAGFVHFSAMSLLRDAFGGE